ncbi:MAG: response regulator [Lacisediminihabitans sp.]
MTSEHLTVLVVDDDYRVASVHVGFVERVAGFRVIGQAHSAAEALELVRTHRPDLVLMDIYLPDGSGLDVVRRLLTSSSAPAVFIISAATDIENVRLAVQLGAVHYLVKPFSFAALEERLTTFRNAHTHILDWPDDATQEDINKVFDLLRPTHAEELHTERRRLAPTLQLIYDALASHSTSLSAADVAVAVGISRATAQRALTQLEQSQVIKLELRYGSAGRPEHRYSLKQR